MKFKVGDRVRGTRNCFISMAQNKIIPEEILIRGFEIKEIRDGIAFFDVDKGHYENDLELVPEEPEFKQGELIEVRDHEDGNWYRLPFIYKIPGKARNRYITVTALDVHAYSNNQEYSVEGWRYARKIKPQLTRKEIAEKFGVSEDFTLID